MDINFFNEEGYFPNKLVPPPLFPKQFQVMKTFFAFAKSFAKKEKFFPAKVEPGNVRGFTRWVKSEIFFFA